MVPRPCSHRSILETSRTGYMPAWFRRISYAASYRGKQLIYQRGSLSEGPKAQHFTHSLAWDTLILWLGLLYIPNNTKELLQVTQPDRALDMLARVRGTERITRRPKRPPFSGAGPRPSDVILGRGVEEVEWL